MGHWFSYLLLGCITIFSSSSPNTASTYDGRYSATAQLNDSAWFGKAVTLKHFASYDKPCTERQFMLGIITDIPHTKGYHDPNAPITGCMDKCLSTQHLSFTGVPLKVGKHGLASLTKCNGVPSTSISYELLDGGDVSVATFHAQKGWIEVTKYNPISKEIEGKFEVRLQSSEGEVMQFNRGKFKTKMDVY